jgi:hypothetical protein
LYRARSRFGKGVRESSFASRMTRESVEGVACTVHAGMRKEGREKREANQKKCEIHVEGNRNSEG